MKKMSVNGSYCGNNLLLGLRSTAQDSCLPVGRWEAGGKKVRSKCAGFAQFWEVEYTSASHTFVEYQRIRCRSGKMKKNAQMGSRIVSAPGLLA